jgi:chaperonin GroES
MSDKLDLQPIFSRIIIKRKEIDKIGSIIVPVSAESMKATEGTVLAVGDEVDIVSEGDTVFFGKYTGAEIERGGQKYIVCNEEDIIAIVHKK